MDLRRRLVVHLGALILCLLLVTLAITVYSVRSDAAAEVRASERLARTMLAAGELGHGDNPEAALAKLQAILADGPLRHLRVTLAGQPAPPISAEDDTAGWLAPLLAVAPSGESHRIRFGNAELLVTPNPASEIDEILHDAVRLFITLLLFSGATLVVAWNAAHHALAPVRKLEEGLDRLAQGELKAGLPDFELREFSRIASAIDHLAASLAEAQRGQRQLAQELISLQEGERRQLAAELHDEMGQMLAAIGVTAAYLERHGNEIPAGQISGFGRELQQDVRAIGQQLRSMLKRLRPHGLEGLGLKDALSELLDGWQQREAGIHFELRFPANFPPVTADVGLVIYRVVQEALTNTVRHSGATACSVELEVCDEALALSVCDNGRGNPGHVGHHPGTGLLGMRERLAMVAGTLSFADHAPRGLQLAVRIPLPPDEHGKCSP